jgi:GNAT superfamily N-acetyltransferase
MARFEFRRTGKADVTFCWPIYREAIEPLAVEFGAWDEAAQRRAIEATLDEEGASIMTANALQSGWLYVTESRHVIHLVHLYLLPELRNRGLGASFLQWMRDRSRRKGKALTVEVMKNSPARFLFERFGFRVTATSPHTLTMRLDHVA